MFKICGRIRGCILVRSFIRNGEPKYSSFSNQLIPKNIKQNYLCTQRNISRYIFKFLYLTDKQLKEKDQVSPSYRLIYKGSSMNYIKYGYQFIAAVFGASASGFILKKIFVPEAKTLLSIAEPYHVILAASFSLVLCIAVHDLSEDYVYRMYYSEEDDKYLAILMDKHPFAEKMIEIFPGTLTVYTPPKILLVLPWKYSLFHTDEKKILLLVAEGFEHLGHYNKLLKKTDQ